MTTSLTPEQQQIVLYWPQIAHVPVIPARTRTKEIHVSGWQNLDLDKVDYESNLQSGLYDEGIAIRLGKGLTNSNDKPLYTFALDFDGENAVNKWFGSWEDVLKLSKKTRTEWHEDKTRIHVIFMSERPVSNKKIHIESSFLEVRCENNLLFASPSIHKDGKAYSVIGTEEICILNQNDLLHLEARIENLLSDESYMSDDNKEAYDKWLDLPTTIIGEGQGRHDALKFKIIRYYYKYQKHWRRYTDQQRFDLAWKWNESHCDPPKPKEEFDSLCKWVVEHHKEKRDELHSKFPRESEQATQSASLMFLAKNVCKEFFLDQYQKPYAAIISGGTLGMSSQEFFLEQARQDEIEYEKKTPDLPNRKDLAPAIALLPTRREIKPVVVGGHTEVVELESKRFRNYILGIYYKLTRNRIPNAESVKNVINVLCYLADFEGGRKQLHERVAGIPGFSILYDLTNKNWEMVKVTSEGWNVEPAPIIFRRHNNEEEQVYPSKEYPEDIFDQFMKLLNVKGKNEKLLLKCYIISLFIAEIPKPILMLYGSQGAAKSMMHELIRSLVDPRVVGTLAFPRDINELVQKLSHNYVAYFDNISEIKHWISDQLCRAVTGSGFSKRELWTNDDDIIYNFKRCVGFNGINLAADKADLLDRGLIIPLDIIPENERKYEQDIRKQFIEIKHKVLGYIFDILVKVLAKIGSMELSELPRMADFALYGETISRCMGNEDNTFLGAYKENIKLQTEQVIETSSIAHVVIKFMKNRNAWPAFGDEKIGTAAELLSQLNETATEMGLNTRAKGWPKQPNQLSKMLNEIRTNLKEVGIEVEWNKNVGTSKSRTITVRKTPSPPSPPSPEHGNGDDTPKTIDAPSPASSPEAERENDQIDDGDDRDDALHTLLEPSPKGYRCKYCACTSSSRFDYSYHLSNEHGMEWEETAGSASEMEKDQ